MENLRDTTLLVGRILLIAVFVNAGIGKLLHPAAVERLMAANGIPMVSAGLALTIAIELGCSLLMVLGYKVRWAAIIMIIWFIPVTIIFHVMTHETVQYLKNIGIMGGLVMIIGSGAGRFSLDGRAETVSETARSFAA